MRVSNRLRRNISFMLLVVGIVCIVARAWNVVINPHSGRAWFEFIAIVILTYLCFDRFRELRRRVSEDVN